MYINCSFIEISIKGRQTDIYVLKTELGLVESIEQEMGVDDNVMSCHMKYLSVMTVNNNYSPNGV